MKGIAGDVSASRALGLVTQDGHRDFGYTVKGLWVCCSDLGGCWERRGPSGHRSHSQ